MKEITLSKKEFEQIDEGLEIEFDRFGFVFYAVMDAYGDWITPNGTRFTVNIFAPNNLTLTIRDRRTGRSQNFEGE